MRRFMFLFVLLLIVGSFATCCKKEKEASVEKKIESKEENLYLMEKDVEAFIEAFPVFVEITKQKEKEVEPLSGKEDFISGMRLAGEFKEYKEEIDGALKKYGFKLESFAAAYGKILAAYSYGQMAGTTSELMERMLDNPNVPEEKKEEIRKGLKEAEESPEIQASKKNWKIVKEYKDEIENLFKEK